MRPLVLCLLCSIAYGEETSCVCPEGTNGYRPGEALEQRITRLEREAEEKAVALRLARAELIANRKRGKR
jgi:hypothetical protein